MNQNIMKWLIIIYLALSIFMACGGPNQINSAPNTSTHNFALIKGTSNFWVGHNGTLITAVDGKKVNRAYSVEVSPGQHTVRRPSQFKA